LGLDTSANEPQTVEDLPGVCAGYCRSRPHHPETPDESSKLEAIAQENMNYVFPSIDLFPSLLIGVKMPAATALPVFKSPCSHVDLIPWDPESSEHVERMVQQRIACGWKYDVVEKWKPLQREGRIALQWVVR
jgi:hypothetical protein